MILTACTPSQFNDLPHYRWVSLPNHNEVKIGGCTVGIKLNGVHSFKMFKTSKEAYKVFESFVGTLRNR